MAIRCIPTFNIALDPGEAGWGDERPVVVAHRSHCRESDGLWRPLCELLAGMFLERSSKHGRLDYIRNNCTLIPRTAARKVQSQRVWCACCAVLYLVQMSAMEVDSAVDAGVEEQKGEGNTMPAAAAAAERTQKGKGEGDRNVMLHPVCCTLLFKYLVLAVAVLTTIASTRIIGTTVFCSSSCAFAIHKMVLSVFCN